MTGVSNETRTFSFNVFVRRAPDVAGQWVGHCPEVDVVSQGNSLRQAYEMTKEAVEIVVLDDLDAGRDPTLRAAPKAEWEAAFSAVQAGNPKLYAMRELFENEDLVRIGVIAPVVLEFVRVTTTNPGVEEVNAGMAQAA